MNENRKSENVVEQIDDLVTGQLPLFAALRLRSRIAHSATLAQIYHETRQLHAELQELPAASDRKRRSGSRRTALMLRGLTMRPRIVALLVGTLTVASVTGAIASRYLNWIDFNQTVTGMQRGNASLSAGGRFRGAVRWIAPDGKMIQEMKHDGISPADSLRVSYYEKNRTVATAELMGIGRHPLKDAHGTVVAYIEMAPMTEAEDQKFTAAEAKGASLLAEYYRNPARVTPTTDTFRFFSLIAIPDMVGDDITERHYYAPRKIDFQRRHWVSWKSYGDVDVRSALRVPAVDSTVVDTARRDGRPPMVHFGNRTIVDEAGSGVVPTDAQLAELTPMQRHVIEMLKTTPHTTPETYWSIGDPEAGLNTATGQYWHVVRSGKFLGYGHFVVRDAAGHALLTLDVKRPTQKNRLTRLLGSDIFKPQKIVPGWDGEE